MLLIYCSIKIGIFWDNIVFVSKMSDALYKNGVFDWMAISADIDPGHPPLLATYIASLWKLLGKSLWVSHLAMLPFVYGFLYQLFIFIDQFIKDKWLSFLAFLLVVADPTLLAQLITVNFEVIQLFFFFLSLNALINNNHFLKCIGLALLSIVSYRGMMLAAGIFLIDILIHVFINKNSFKSFFNKKNITVYFLGAIPALAYIIWRLIMKGWIISNPLQPWGNAMDYTSSSGFLLNFIRNIAVLIHRYLDFGRFTIFIFIVVMFIMYQRKIFSKNLKILLIIALGSVFAIISASLVLNDPMGHRYFIPSYLSFALLAFILLKDHIVNKTARISIYLLLVSSLVIGNFIIYPDKISQGWDASLAHIPYWHLREEAIKYLDHNDIPIHKTASFFPNDTSIDNVELNNDDRSFQAFTGKEDYVLYSNVFNVKDARFKLLNENYSILSVFKNNGVRVEILKRNKN